MTALVGMISMYSRSRYMARMDSSAYMTTASLSGAADGKQFTASFWLNSYNGAASRGVFQITSDFYISFTRNTNGTAFINLNGALSGSTKLSAQSTSAISMPTGTTPKHFYITVDLSSASKRAVYADGVSVPTTWGTYTNANITQTGSFQLGLVGGSYIESDVYDFWYDDNYYAVGTYLSAFYNGGVSPNLGANGQIPTGSSPLVYVNGYNNFQNRGTGGSFTTSGSITQGEAAPI